MFVVICVGICVCVWDVCGVRLMGVFKGDGVRCEGVFVVWYGVCSVCGVMYV